jgi:hypothetical protein
MSQIHSLTKEEIISLIKEEIKDNEVVSSQTQKVNWTQIASFIGTISTLLGLILVSSGFAFWLGSLDNKIENLNQNQTEISQKIDNNNRLKIIETDIKQILKEK